MRNKIIICGCGPSVEGFVVPKGWDVFGCNDSERWISADYLLCVNEDYCFPTHRWNYIYNTNAKEVYTHIGDLPIHDKTKLKFIKLGDRLGRNPDRKEIDYSFDSPYMAVILAYQMGYREIALIGVDHTNHKMLNKYKDDILEEYRLLAELLQVRGCLLWNLSKESLVNWTYLDLNMVDHNSQTPPSL